MRVGYGRVSSTKEEQGISIESQEREFRDAGCDEVIVERRSAYKGRRPGWERLWELVASGTVAEVLVNDQSRLSRSGDDQQFLAACAEKGVIVRALVGGVLESESYEGFLSTSLQSVINKAHSKLLSIKTAHGIARRKAAGYYGCGKVPFGYCVIDGRVAPHPQHFEEAQVMFQQLLEQQMNISGWIRATGMPWTPGGVRKWIANPMLRGCVRGEWDAVDAVVSWADWQRAQDLLAVRRGIRGSAARRVHLFTGLVRCAGCGKTLHTVRQGERVRLKCLWRLCDSYGRGMSQAVARRLVIEALAGRAAELAAHAAGVEQVEPPEAAVLRAKISRLAGLEDEPEVAAVLERLQAQLRHLQQQDVSVDSERLRSLFADPGTLELATDEELRAVMLEFVASISWPGGWESLTITLR